MTRATQTSLLIGLSLFVSAQFDARAQNELPESVPMMTDGFGDDVSILRLTFFPPTTPVFGSPISEPVTSPSKPKRGPLGDALLTMGIGRGVAAPEDIADYVNEAFYPALGTRLSEKKLSKALAGRLAAYRSERAMLVNELQNELATVQSADADTRERQLHEFARGQTPKITALENEAEDLRHDLVAGSLLSLKADWNLNRTWKLGVPEAAPTLPGRPMPPGRAASIAERAEFQVLRAAVYFQNGLSPEQRDLLCEVALIQQEQIYANGPVRARAARDSRTIFFSPATTRFAPPDDLPPDLQTRIEAYTDEKNALKKELRDAIVAQDKFPDAKRTRALYDLAGRQEPRLAALEAMAEDIRHRLAHLPPLPPPPLPPRLPAGLPARIASYLHDRDALEQERLQHGGNRTVVRITGGVGNSPPPFEQLREASQRARAAAQHDDATFQLENAARYEALAETQKSITHDLTVFAQTQLDPDTGEPMDAKSLLRRISFSDRAFEQIGRENALYPDYRAAMLEPGLSPEQRRLLFGRALADLAQPLPPGEPMPRGNVINSGLGLVP